MSEDAGCQFGEFRFEPGRRALWRGAARVQVTAKAFELLAALLERPGSVIEKDVLLKRVWGDAFVEEKNLTVQIATLRKALGDDPQSPRFIATVTGRGYQFIAAVTRVQRESPLEDVPQPAPAPRRWALPLSLGVGLAALGLAVAIWGRGRDTAVDRVQVQSLAILPFQPLDPARNDPDLQLGLADLLATRISALKTIAVRPTSAVLPYAAPGQDPVAAGGALGVDAVVEGNLQHAGNRVRVTVRLVDVSRGGTVWGDSFDAPASDRLTAEDSLAAQMLSGLERVLTGSDEKRLVRVETRNTAAFRAYLRGRHFWAKWTPDSVSKAIEQFEEALREDDKFALAYAGLADAHAMMGYLAYAPPRAAFPKALSAAARALSLDSSVAEAHLALAKAHLFYEWDFPGARREIDRALALDPNYADGYAMRGTDELAIGDFDGALADRQRALQLNPTSALVTTSIGWVYFYRRQSDEAIGWYKKALELDPQFATAREDIANALHLSGRAGSAPGYWGQQLADARAAVPPDAFRIARIHYELGDFEKAVDWFERAFDERASLMIFLEVNPMFDRLRDHPRFKALVRRIRPRP